MKKIFLTLFVALMSVSAFAQAGEKSVGLNLSYGTEISNIGIGIEGQYGITDAIRVEAGFDYFLEKDYLKMWDINVNAHYLFPIANSLKVYPLAGVTYTNWSVDLKDFGLGSASEGKFGVNLGAGIDYDLTETWKLNAEIKYQLISDFNQAVFSVGAAYKF